MKKLVINISKVNISYVRKSIVVLFLLAVCNTGQALIGNPGGNGGVGIYTGPIGSNGDGIHVVGDPSLMNPQLTPPCIVSDNCNEDINYMPVWRQGPNNTVVECSSPLYVRKDAFTCNRMLRINLFENQGTFGTSWINPSICPGCNIGFVGINAIQPEEQLHVIGNIKCQEGKFIGKISTGGIYGELQNDPDGIPYSGDEEYGTIEVQNSMNFNNGFTAGNATITDLSVSNLNTSNIVASSLNVPYINVSDNAFIRRLSIGNLTNGIPKRPNGAFGNYALSVDGTIVSTRNVVQITSWADKVFQKNYKLMSLSEIEAFVKQYKHLPEIPSESEIIENGVDVGEMNKLLLQKVEELTLHLIEQDKIIKALKKKVDGLTK
ncbi:MAG: hypothetical protein JNL75_05275 [Chitinophagales bacterium]|nr:hypothetical protein [Chitinophagales bacterium]